MRLHPSVLVAALVLNTAACASSSSGASRPQLPPDRSLRWSGDLQPTRTRSEAAMAPTEITKAYGTVLLTVAGGSGNRTRARLTISAPVQSATELRWAIVPGRCGANSLPVLGFDAFPVLEVGNTGRGQLDVEIPFTLPTEGQYHVNVYWRGQQLSDVMTCGNLKLGGR